MRIAWHTEQYDWEIWRYMQLYVACDDLQQKKTVIGLLRSLQIRIIDRNRIGMFVWPLY